MPIPDHLAIPDTATLTALQEHMQRTCTYMGWDKATNEQTFLLFVEEVGELAKAMRNATRLFQEPDKRSFDEQAIRRNLADEFADVFNYLLDLANRFDTDLGQAYAAKMTANFGREWV